MGEASMNSDGSKGEELAYAIISSHSIVKSRTGNILSRLISRTELELVSGAVFSPSRVLAERYAEMVVAGGDEGDEARRMLSGYLREKFVEVPEGEAGARRRVLMLVFRGEDAVARVKAVVGEIARQREGGETIRDTYGELISDESGEVIFYEPAVLIAETREEVQAHLELWAKYSDKDAGIREGAAAATALCDESGCMEKTLVLIKPDNFRYPNIRPGALIDVFSRTGLCMIGFKVLRMSVAQAEAFYGPVLPVLQELYRDQLCDPVREYLDERYEMSLRDEDWEEVAHVLGPVMGRNHWEKLVAFMSGRRPGDVVMDGGDKEDTGTQQAIGLVYEGVDAVRKIRAVLGPTDPSKAPAGTIRREFGSTVMINAAHASDSPENADREMGLVGMAENHFKDVVTEFYDGARGDGEAVGVVKKLQNLFH
ncbi:MAG: nucleoside-diphosphate kinase [Verrucomicrobiota bacterium]